MRKTDAGSPDEVCDVIGLLNYLAAMPPGALTDLGLLVPLLAAAWDEFTGDDGGMQVRKLNRIEKVTWTPPILTFTIERHPGTARGSSRAPLQEWTLNLETMTTDCAERRFRQVQPRQRRLDMELLVEEVGRLIVAKQEDERLRWYEDGRVRVLVGKLLPKGSAVKETLASRRKKFRVTLRTRLAEQGWEEVGVNVYRKKNARLA